jgi:hypothetical protein
MLSADQAATIPARDRSLQPEGEILQQICADAAILHIWLNYSL